MVLGEIGVIVFEAFEFSTVGPVCTGGLQSAVEIDRGSRQNRLVGHEVNEDPGQREHAFHPGARHVGYQWTVVGGEGVLLGGGDLAFHLPQHCEIENAPRRLVDASAHSCERMHLVDVFHTRRRADEVLFAQHDHESDHRVAAGEFVTRHFLRFDFRRVDIVRFDVDRLHHRGQPRDHQQRDERDHDVSHFAAREEGFGYPAEVPHARTRGERGNIGY